MNALRACAERAAPSSGSMRDDREIRIVRERHLHGLLHRHRACPARAVADGCELAPPALPGACAAAVCASTIDPLNTHRQHHRARRRRRRRAPPRHDARSRAPTAARTAAGSTPSRTASRPPASRRSVSSSASVWPPMITKPIARFVPDADAARQRPAGSCRRRTPASSSGSAADDRGSPAGSPRPASSPCSRSWIA